MEYDETLLVQRLDSVKLSPEHGLKQQPLPLTLHCSHCNTVLGDCSGICGEMKAMDAILCLKVTNNVMVSDTVETGHKGDLSYCIYKSLKCRDCGSAVGKVILSGPSHLSSIRSLFLLLKAKTSCYILNSRSMVKAATLSFDEKPLGPNILEVRKQFEAMLDHMVVIKNRATERSMASELDKQIIQPM